MKTYEVPATIDLGSITKMVTVQAENEDDALIKAVEALDRDFEEVIFGYEEMIYHINALNVELDAYIDADPTQVREVI